MVRRKSCSARRTGNIERCDISCIVLPIRAAPSEQWDWNTPTIFTGRCEISSSLQILLANFDSRLACLPVMQGDDLTKNRVKDRVKAKFQGTRGAVALSCSYCSLIRRLQPTPLLRGAFPCHRDKRSKGHYTIPLQRTIF